MNPCILIFHNLNITHLLWISAIPDVYGWMGIINIILTLAPQITPVLHSFLYSKVWWKNKFHIFYWKFHRILSKKFLLVMFNASENSSAICKIVISRPAASYFLWFSKVSQAILTLLHDVTVDFLTALNEKKDVTNWSKKC